MEYNEIKEPMARTMREMSLDSRPREKALKHGVGSLDIAELIAVIIGSGSQGENVSLLCQRLIDDHGGKLYNLSRRSVHDLMNNYRGIGEVKALQILAAIELAKRIEGEEFDERRQITSSGAAYAFFSPMLRDKSNEHIMVALLNRRKEIIHSQVVSAGGVAFAQADVKMIVKPAIEHLADGLIMAHNHPSDNPKPSRQDDDLTDRVKAACDALDITLLDHIIVCRGRRYYSYNDEGKL